MTAAAKGAVRAAMMVGLVDSGGRLPLFLSYFSISVLGDDDGGPAVDGPEKADGWRGTVGGGQWVFSFLKMWLE